MATVGEPIKGDDDLDRVADALASALNPGEEYLLILLTPTPAPKGEATRVRTCGTVDGELYVRMLSEVLMNVARNRVGPERRIGNALIALGQRKIVKLFELAEAMVKGSGKALGVPPAAWVDLMLIWSANTAHDAGVSREDYLAGALETIDEEWSTPSANGREALRNLMGRGRKPV